MNKLDKIGYYNIDTGEPIDMEIYESIRREERSKRYSKLKKKFTENTISKEELLELFKLEKKPKDIHVLYESFYKVNMCKSKPAGITDSEYGKFFQMLNFLSYKNTMAYSNGKVIKAEKISEFLGFKTIKSFRNYIRKLQRNRMLAETTLGGVEYLVINPAYAQRKMNLNRTIYMLFKEDLKDMLDEYQIRLLELEDNTTELSSILAIDY